MSKNSNIKYIPEENWKNLPVQPTAGKYKKTLNYLYVLMLPLSIMVFVSLVLPVNIQVYFQIVLVAFIAFFSLLILLFTFVGYFKNKKEMSEGYTTWDKPKNKQARTN